MKIWRNHSEVWEVRKDNFVNTKPTIHSKTLLDFPVSNVQDSTPSSEKCVCVCVCVCVSVRVYVCVHSTQMKERVHITNS